MMPRGASAQMDVNGMGWIHQGDGDGTMLHAMYDSMSTLEFPAYCLGGMMAPDSVLAEMHELPSQEQPPESVVALQCDILDPDGQTMMGGSMMGTGMFQQSLAVTVHYDPEAVSAMGLDPSQLCLARWTPAGYVIETSALPDPGTNSFHLTTSRLAATYAVIDRNNASVPAPESSWGGLKLHF